MRRYIFASHHKLAFGLKDTVQFLNNYSSAANQIYDINAYVDDKETDISDQVEQLFASFSKEDEVIVLTDMQATYARMCAAGFTAIPTASAAGWTV